MKSERGWKQKKCCDEEGDGRKERKRGLFNMTT